MGTGYKVHLCGRERKGSVVYVKSVELSVSIDMLGR